MRKIIALLFIVLYSMANSNQAKTIEALAKEYIGGKYIWGGETPQGFDCSGYTQYIYKQVGITLPRTALLQSKVGTIVIDESYKKGDLLFFLTDKTRGISITHVGIYLEDNKFIHAASTKKGIIISDLTKSKYGSLLVSVSRVLSQEQREIFQPIFFSEALKRAVHSNSKIRLISQDQESNQTLSKLEEAIKSDSKVILQ
ncbi:C40 family peptidase [Sulfurovum sp. bin170]|uniref:C40 family peptidase n=1 Tax=Sulfurovum sp. bin170 TaxID=2695268 RepID=UPI0013E03F68|nr:C40 family peptidase [Sulfurovum sp. bin170]NEW59902.1 C40 family peptidase [Sulfurovum sp. bin170]